MVHGCPVEHVISKKYFIISLLTFANNYLKNLSLTKITNQHPLLFLIAFDMKNKCAEATDWKITNCYSQSAKCLPYVITSR